MIPHAIGHRTHFIYSQHELLFLRFLCVGFHIPKHAQPLLCLCFVAGIGGSLPVELSPLKQEDYRVEPQERIPVD